MNPIFLIIIVLFPALTSVLIHLIKFKNRRHMMWFTEFIVLATSLLVWALLLNRPEETITLFKFTGNLSVSFKLDGLACVFAGLVSILWPLATFYSFEYMKHEEHEQVFFMFYTMTYGVTLGIATSSNIFSMYFFYELLTIVTTPLVIHTLKKEAVDAARKYIYYSMGGAAFAFIGMVFVIIYGSPLEFTYGGVLKNGSFSGNINTLYLIYVLAFMGFGVKAAIWPLCGWLPKAGVAPTPVTALLHAVAVVKSGAYATMRLTYYCFGVDLLKGSWAQETILVFTIITIVYGCSMAVKDRHIKRRLAYSTVSNLSYILFGVALMSPLGLIGALSHMIAHAFMKICSFFCAGAIMYKTERHYVYQLDGFGRKMPKVFTIFTISAFALMGVPGLPGFVSKFNLAKAAVESGSVLAYVGVGALLVSALLTAIYMLTIVVRAFFPKDDFDYETIKDVEDPNYIMILPLTVFVIFMFIIGLYPKPLLDLFATIAAGNF